MRDQRRVRISVSGRVQGVFFRTTVADAAGRLGVNGWVRNTRDGRVEAEVQGPPEQVEELIAICREGPPLARVERVEVTELAPTDREAGFRVR